MAAEEAGFQSVEEESTTPRVPPPPEEPPKASVGGGAKPSAVAKPSAPKSRYPPPPPAIAGSSMSKIAAGVASKKAAPQKELDLSLFPWTFKGVEYYTNDRKDVLTKSRGWVGRFNGISIDKSAPNPADMADPEIRQNDF